MDSPTQIANFVAGRCPCVAEEQSVRETLHIAQLILWPSGGKNVGFASGVQWPPAPMAVLTTNSTDSCFSRIDDLVCLSVNAFCIQHSGFRCI
jgi:hypothetical protein